MLALINVKKEKIVIRNLNVVDSQNQFEFTMCKWCKITHVVNGCGHSTQHKNVISCKENWGEIYLHFK